jgi:hypothetical protein
MLGNEVMDSYPYEIRCRRSNGDSRVIHVRINSERSKVKDIIDSLWVDLRNQGIDQNTHQVRLIYAGKLLSPGSALLTTFNLVPDAFVHFVVSETPLEASSSSSTTTQNRGLRQFAANMGAFILGSIPTASNASSDSPNGQQNVLNSVPVSPRVRGLGVLQATHGLSADEVASLRAIFQEDIAAFAVTQGLPQYIPNDEGSVQAETVWLLHQGSGSEFMANLPRRRSSAGNVNDTLQEGRNARSRLLARLRNTGMEESGVTPLDASDQASSASSGRGSIFSALFRQSRNQGNDNGMDSAQQQQGDIEMGLGRQNRDDDSDLPPVSQSNLPDTGEIAGVLQGINELGTAKDWIWGFMLGCSFGTLMLLCVFERSMNYRNKLGIISGVFMQVMLAIAIRPELDAVV